MNNPQSTLTIPNELQQTIALWLAQKATPTMISRRLNVELTLLAELQSDPRFNLQVDEMRKELITTNEISPEEQVANLTRDVIGIIHHHAYSGNEKISLDAAKTLFDRQLPKRTMNENLNKLTVEIKSEALDGIFKVFREAAGLKEADLVDLSEEEQLKMITDRTLGAV